MKWHQTLAVTLVALFLSGRHNELVAGLRERMEGSAATLDFERAARVLGVQIAGDANRLFT